MNILSQISSTGRNRDSFKRLATLVSLLSSLRLVEVALIERIAAEEDRSKICDPADPMYPLTARAMRTRLDNIRRTLSKLEALKATRPLVPVEAHVLSPTRCRGS